MMEMVGAEGFEPTTPASQTLCATRLRYAPTNSSITECGVLVKRQATIGAFFHALLAVADVQHLLTQPASSNDAPSSQPDPDVIQAALDQLGLSPEDAILNGDTPYDIQAADKAGVRRIALRSGGWDDRAFEGALVIYDHPADLLAHLDELDLFAG